VRTDLVRRFGLAALWTRTNGHCRQGIVGPTLCGARLRMASFGIRHGLVLLRDHQFLQRREAWVVPRRLAATCRPVQIRAALRAQAFARFSAQRFHRQRQLKLLAEHLDHIERTFAMVGSRQIVLVDLTFTIVGDCRPRHVTKFELCLHGELESLETAAAFDLQVCHRVTGDPKYSCPGFLDVHRQLDRRSNPVLFVLRIESRGLENPLEVLAVAVEPVEIEEHGLLAASGPEREPVIIPRTRSQPVAVAAPLLIPVPVQAVDGGKTLVVIQPSN